jgi:hypothetical protein
VSNIGVDRDLGLLERLLAERRSEFPDPQQVEGMLGEVRRLRRKRLRSAHRRAEEVLGSKPRRVRSVVMRGK